MVDYWKKIILFDNFLFFHAAVYGVYKSVLEPYNKKIRPVSHGPINVKVDVIVNSIDDVVCSYFMLLIHIKLFHDTHNIFLQEALTETISLRVVVAMVCNQKYINIESFSVQEWIDEELMWNTSQYNVHRIRIPSTDIWLPDIVFSRV
jgi:hypothetical protein